MEINIDQVIYWEWRFLKLNATLLFTWLVMLLLVGTSVLITRQPTPKTGMSRGQALLESLVEFIKNQIVAATGEKADKYLSFVSTLFLFIVVSNTVNIIPGFHSPTASLSTTAALALCVFVAVPVFGITSVGAKNYFRYYIEPTPLMLPFNIIGELSRTLALAIRLFGNIMSGSLIAAILLSLAPLFFPVAMQAFGLLIGVIQAYVFAILALVYVASAGRIRKKNDPPGYNNTLNHKTT